MGGLEKYWGEKKEKSRVENRKSKVTAEAPFA